MEMRFEVVRKNGTRDVMFDARFVMCGGWSGRDASAVAKHIEELEKIGVPRPAKVPIIFPVSRYLLTQDEGIEVQAKGNSGEVEYVVLVDDDATYVTLGSDHTDRELERFSVDKAKQACPKIVARQAWLYEDVRDHWDQIVLRSYATKEERVLYQEARLDNLIDVETLINLDGGKPKRQGSVVFSGTIPTKGGIIFADGFDMEMIDEKLSRSIIHGYEISVLT